MSVFSTFKEVQSQRNKGIDLLYEVIGPSAHRGLISCDQRLSHQIHVILLICRKFWCKCDHGELRLKALVMWNWNVEPFEIRKICLFHVTKSSHKNIVANSGFLRWGTSTPEVGANLLFWPILPSNCMEMKIIIEPKGRVIVLSAPRPPAIC